jgi:succinate dehydrogenase/fumarate reductase cytochrome b subunit
MHAGSWIRTTHRISAAVLAIFLIAHLINHVAGLWGIAAHQAFMDAARLVYRSAVLEPLLLGAVLVQIVTGTAQLRASWGERRGFWARTQSFSGLYLAFFLANHTFWVLVARIGYGLDSNFYLAATFLTVSPLPLLFAPYYVLGIVALFAHISCAVHFRLPGTIGERIAAASIGAGVVIAPVIVAVFMGAFYDIQLPPAYRALVAPYL